MKEFEYIFGMCGREIIVGFGLRGNIDLDLYYRLW
jgi:hypothetical protein